MKKKRKNWEKEKNLGYFIIVGLLVLASFVCIFLIFILPTFNEPEFKITKNECFMKGNQTIYNNCVAKYEGDLNIEGTSYTIKITPNLEDGLILFEFSENSSMSSLNIGGKIIETKNCINISLLYESCQPVEVDEILITKSEFVVNSEEFCLNSMKTHGDYFFEDDEGKIHCILFGYTPKENIDLEWLDAYCECKDYTNDFYKNLICQKYKCEFDETYFVEVLK